MADLIKLSDVSPKPPGSIRKKEALKELENFKGIMREQLQKLQAGGDRSLLIVLQGMDASGKDSLIRKVFSGLNPALCRVQAFGRPTEEELKHDFLWRVHPHTPSRGMMQVFNRSYYEDVLVPRIQGKLTEKQLKKRYGHINDFERLLQEETNCIILKFYMHLSRKKQRKKLDERMKDPEKAWKYEPADTKAAEKWDAYMDAYEATFAACSEEVPWHIIPANKKWYKNYLVASLVSEVMEGMKMK